MTFPWYPLRTYCSVSSGWGVQPTRVALQINDEPWATTKHSLSGFWPPWQVYDCIKSQSTSRELVVDAPCHGFPRWLIRPSPKGSILSLQSRLLCNCAWDLYRGCFLGTLWYSPWDLNPNHLSRITRRYHHILRVVCEDKRFGASQFLANWDTFILDCWHH